MPSLVYLTKVGGTLFAVYDNGDRVPMLDAGGERIIPSRKAKGDEGPVEDDGTSIDDPGENPTVPTGEGITITAQMVRAAVTALGGSESAMLQTPEAVAAGFNDALDNTFGRSILSTRERAAQLIAQTAQETGGYRLIKEGGMNPSVRYWPYIGRGWIQVTWRDGYLSFGRFMKKWGVITDENLFVNNPSALEDLKYAPYTAVWEFTYKSFNPHGNLFGWCNAPTAPEVVGRIINTGNPWTTFKVNGQALRLKAYYAVLAVTPKPVSRAAIVAPMKAGTYTLSAYFGQTGSWARYHTGQDFAANTGTPVYAVADGTILGGMGFPAAGTSLVLSFGQSEEAAYWHLSSTNVVAGQKVKAGDKIGEVGNTGNSFGPHLHFEYYPPNSTYKYIYTAKNPRTWLREKGVVI